MAEFGAKPPTEDGANGDDEPEFDRSAQAGGAVAVAKNIDKIVD